MSPRKKADEKKTIRVRQVRSGIGCPREMRETLKALADAARENGLEF